MNGMRDQHFEEGLLTVRLDIVDIREIKPYVGILSRKLCAARRRRMHTYLREEDRLRCLGGGLLMQRALGTDDLPPDPYGKPTLPNHLSSDLQCQFNLSHSGNYAVLALCREAIGVDMEEMLEIAYAQLAKICFHPDERALLDHTPEDHKRLLFYKLWTLKESYTKAVGLGLSMTPHQFAIRPDDYGGASVSGRPAYRFSTEVFMSDYTLSICVAAPYEPVIVRREYRASDFLGAV